VTITTRPCPGCGTGEPRQFAEKNAHEIVRCGRCATLYTIDGVERVYDDAYASEIESAPFLSRRLDDIVAAFASSWKTGRLLDVGFGFGDLLDAARRAGWDVSGVEVARPAVERARRRGIDAFHGRLSDARYEPESFDVILGVELLEHVIDVEPLLTDIARLLRPGGLLWATTPHARGLSARLLGPSWSVIAPPSHVQLFSIMGLRELLHRTGFVDVSMKSEGLNPHELAQHIRGKRISAGQRIEAACAINAYFEEQRGRRVIKRAVNRALSALRLGDSLKVSARKS